MRIIGIGGEPGTGKSALVLRLIERLDEEGRPVRLNLLHASYFIRHNLTILGIYDGSTFSGTDKLAMNVHADAKAFLQAFAPTSNATVLFEGDRLFGETFLNHCRTVTPDCHWIILEANSHNKVQRRKDRGSDQDATWLKGRVSRLSKLLTTVWPVEVWSNNSLVELDQNVDRLHSLILQAVVNP